MNLTSYTISRTQVLSELKEFARDFIGDLIKDVITGDEWSWKTSLELINKLKDVENKSIQDLSTFLRNYQPWIAENLLEEHPEADDILMWDERTNSKVVLISRCNYVNQ